MVAFMLALMVGYLGIAAAVGLIVWYVVLFCKALIEALQERVDMNAREWLWFWIFIGLYVVVTLLFGLNGMRGLSAAIIGVVLYGAWKRRTVKKGN